MSRIYYSLYDRLLHREALERAFAKVRRAKGAPGVDGQSIADLAGLSLTELYRTIEALDFQSLLSPANFLQPHHGNYS